MIAFVGAGKVATALGAYFKSKGLEIQGYYSRNHQHAVRAAEITGTRAYTDLVELINQSHMIWITTSDDSIENVASQIAGFSTQITGKKLFLHTSGVNSTDILQSIKATGHSVCCAHPLLAFSGDVSSVEKLAETWFTLEYDENERIEINDFFSMTGNPVLTIDGKQKGLYHAACCMMSNYLVTLLDSSYSLFEKIGIEKETIKKATLPLLESVIENCINLESKDALTGPIKRGDKNTVSLHLQQLQNEMPEAVEIYKALGIKTMIMLNDFRLKEIIN